MPGDLESLLVEAFEKGASDVHLTVGVPPVFRIDGELMHHNSEPLAPADTERMARSVLPDEMWQAFEQKGELDFSHGIPGVSRFRMNAYFQRSCISLAVRVVPTSVPTLEDLNMPPVLRDIAKKPQGLVLVTGPTGSGKSTTLAAMVNFMNKTMKRHIITLEDPIEYLHKHNESVVDQREVGFDTRNFANGLRAALRQDPDVILVGEMRDLETIATAVTAAETGHLVLGTLHTTSAASTIERIIDVFPPEQQGQVRIQIASVLSAVVSQRLFKSANGRGRVAATEILISNPAVQNLIRSEKIHQIPTVLQTSRSLGMHTLEMSVNELLRDRKIDNEAASFYISR
ncbi:type IV pilus twitching motility protein PilT [Alteribacter natronophilus]|uniref:type IV pilus twitching motility protein PilT n=1 Tax=Alteribacter natronophilus TaxID=2583810 RepID=UPI00110E45FD|nr:type IV pilus twitching motility protein PilT [Alteribacter natronophilus]TMW71597.1 type IV pilus twitching motility protein PilT [Alteribacter natronophilus]